MHFVIEDASDADFSAQLKESGARIVFYQLASDTTIYMELIWDNVGTKTFGAISGIATEIEAMDDASLFMEVRTFNLHFANTYDQATGVMACELDKLYTYEGVRLRLVLFIGESNMTFTGYKKLNQRYNDRPTEKNFDMVIGTDSTSIKESRDFVRGTYNPADISIQFPETDVANAPCQITLGCLNYDYSIAAYTCGTTSAGEDAINRFVKYNERRDDFSHYITVYDNLENRFLYLQIVSLPKPHADIDSHSKFFRDLYIEKDWLYEIYPRQ